MSKDIAISPERVEKVYAHLDEWAESTGYHLNPDREFTRDLVESLLINRKRYGYQACPCRLASGDKEKDRDIICPCVYRDPDLEEYGRCYCALYVTQGYIDEGMPADPIPERRPEAREQRAKTAPDEVEEAQRIQGNQSSAKGKEVKIWRCQVCGYLCARPGAPSICPICRAKKDRFEEFSIP